MSASPHPPNLARNTLADPRWTAVTVRDRGADGTFFYAVTTTGIYCRPSCPARRPHPRHALFFDTPAAAEAAGFRPCLRCRPRDGSSSQSQAAAIAQVCRLLERSAEPLRLDQLARSAGMSPSHLHRTFKAVTGLTPNSYSAALRDRRVRQTLTKSESITDAIYAAGYNANSRFYERADQALGMTPTRFREGGASSSIAFTTAASSLGTVLVAKGERGICAILLGDDPLLLASDLQHRFPKAQLTEGEEDFRDLVAAVLRLIEEPSAGAELPLDIRGTAFQQRVWQALQRIPAGSTMTYTELAQAIGMPRAVRAVAQACGANHLAVAIPCHRVLRADGALSGYRWGVERKQKLLQREAQKEVPAP